MSEEISDQAAVLLARDALVQARRSKNPHHKPEIIQAAINNLDAWLGDVMHYQRQVPPKQ